MTGGFLDGKYSDRVESYDVDGGYWEVTSLSLLDINLLPVTNGLL